VRASAAAHAGCLSFELSVGLDRIVVNCGAPALESPLKQAARGTAAHSTLALGDHASARILESDGKPLRGVAAWLWRRLGPVILQGPAQVTVERRSDPDGSTLLVGQHDGYAGLGYRHERRLRLSADGLHLSGADRLLGTGTENRAAPPDALLRFHLHPTVAAEMAEDGNSVLLQAGRDEDASLWRFSIRPDMQGKTGSEMVTGRVLALEDSMFFADADGRRPTRQIVVTLGLSPAGEPAPLSWRFDRLAE
jgi:uncharacterized heparinase superfamily protein